MAFASTFELQLADGTPADPPTLTTAAPLWRPRRHHPARPSYAPASLMSATVTSMSAGRQCWSSRTCPNRRLAPLSKAA